MKIQEIIRQRRLDKNYTQEQLAGLLGVTAPAVNKWEKGVSYPDITLLPALARVLGTDLNTLLSFRDDLTRQEMALFLNQVSLTMEREGFAAGYQMALDKLQEYPTSDQLAASLTLLLDGNLTMRGPQDSREEEYREKILSLYRRAAQGKDQDAKSLALPPLIARLMEEKDYEKARELLDTMPSDQQTVDKTQLQARLYMEQGEYEKAGKLVEEKLLLAANGVHMALMILMEIACKEDRKEDAEAIARADQKMHQALDQWEYNQYLTQYLLYSCTQNREELRKLLPALLDSMESPWEPHRSPLYQHIQTKTADPGFWTSAKKALLDNLRREDPELWESLPRETREL